MKPGSVLLLGDLNVDTMMPVPFFPSPGRDGLVEHVGVHVGGGVANSAVVLARLGQPAALITARGADVWGDYITPLLEQAGVSMQAVLTRPDGTTGLTLVISTPDGERTMFSYRGANTLLRPEDIQPDWLDGAALLHLAGYAFMKSPQREAAWRAMALARERGIPISLDTGLEPVLQFPDQIRAALDWLSIGVLGPEEAETLLGTRESHAVMDDLLRRGIRLVGVKLGGRGCILANAGERMEFPIFHVRTVDTTGAGDAFSAGLIHAWLHHYSLAATGTLASALGALATTVYGAGLNEPGRAEVIEFLSSMRGTLEAQPFGAGVDEVLANLSAEPAGQL